LKKNIYITLLLLSSSLSVVAQDTVKIQKDTVSKKEKHISEKKSRKVRLSILGGPGYTPDFGVLIGGSALATFKTSVNDTLLKRSFIPLAFALSQSGVGITSRPQIYFNNDNWRIFGQFVFKNNYEHYYGVGFDKNSDTPRSKETTQYKGQTININPVVMFRMGKTNLFTSAIADLISEKMSDPAALIVEDIDYLSQGGTSKGLQSFNVGLGFGGSYDTRDIPANPYKGIFLDFKFIYYSKFFAGDRNFGNVSIDYRQFKSVGNRKVFAWTVQSKTSFGDVPISRLNFVGSPFDLRGYYMGQYRDKVAHLAILEYRQMINTNRETRFLRLMNNIGFAAWGGSGASGPGLFDIKGILPNFGGGLRVQLQPRMNFRMDIGHNPLLKQNLLYFNITEAF
jgi:hypothetical protein